MRPYTRWDYLTALTVSLVVFLPVGLGGRRYLLAAAISWPFAVVLGIGFCFWLDLRYRMREQAALEKLQQPDD